MEDEEELRHPTDTLENSKSKKTTTKQVMRTEQNRTGQREDLDQVADHTDKLV